MSAGARSEPAHGWRTALPDADIALVAVDLDGTLLTPDHRLPEGFWEVFAALERRGVTLVPASGRQFGSVRRLFGEAGDRLVLIGENGGYVGRGDTVIAVSPMAPESERAVIETLRRLPGDLPTEIVRCGVRKAWVEQERPGFAEHVARYYAHIGLVEDVLAPEDRALKIAVYCHGRSAEVAEHLASFRDRCQVMVSSPDWVDVMPQGVDKGHAVRDLQATLGVTPARTMAFGDYLNDLGMLAAAEWSFAMPGGRAEVREAARFVAPSNAEGGVVQVLRTLLGTG